MKTRGAVLWEVGGEWSVEEIDVGDPRPGEVTVQLAASGLCHSDEHLTTGGGNPRSEIPTLLSLYQAGRLNSTTCSRPRTSSRTSTRGTGTCGTARTSAG
jgi:Zn-dependent alcohol dehydrogenase